LHAFVLGVGKARQWVYEKGAVPASGRPERASPKEIPCVLMHLKVQVILLRFGTQCSPTRGLQCTVLVGRTGAVLAKYVFRGQTWRPPQKPPALLHLGAAWNPSHAVKVDPVQPDVKPWVARRVWVFKTAKVELASKNRRTASHWRGDHVANSCLGLKK